MRGAGWREMDAAGAVWTVPATRMKGTGCRCAGGAYLAGRGRGRRLPGL